MPVRLDALGATVLAAALLTACSDSGGSKHHAVDAAGLRKTLLMTGDLPTTWVAKPHDSSGDDSGGGSGSDGSAGSGGGSNGSGSDAALAACLGLPKSEFDPGGAGTMTTVYSPDFTLGDSTVSSDAQPNDGTSRGALTRALLTSSKAQGCVESNLRQAITTSLPSGTSLTQLDVKVVKSGPGTPKNAQYEIDVTFGIAAGGTPVAAYLTTVDLQSDAVEATVTLQGFGKPIPASVRSAALEAVSKRVDAA